ncbi:putative secreted protein (Por secretion system target) [Tenacibaculum skagerrakense]|uniref:Putative secreted protein (Por secretion system target) n=1 Tax=Tenacibaculum skagerrakense TaxID=186571 RepID=A0A4R2NUS2_9FLAO|nr:alpha-amylase family glycosyl hydrolase [Tenacibaculum skagerrakense]TCP25833.1 putative secreted protein (Por secretion system target) [Tenacibaculum skagerrakense]
MKKFFLFLTFLSNLTLFAQQQNVTFSVNPSTFNEDEEITVTVSNVNPAAWGVTDIYLWAWSFDTNDANIMDSPTNGSWTNSNEAQKLTNNGDGTYSFTFTPTTFYNRTGIGRIGMLVKAKDGTGDKKSQDQLFEVGKFQLNLTSPSSNVTIINSGDNVSITATATLAADFNLKANTTSINTQNGITSYSFNTNVTENTIFELEATDGSEIQTETFEIVVRPTVVEEALPNGLLDGLNLNDADPTKATLVFYAPGKEFVHVIGDFNDWKLDNNYLMKKDSSKDRFWIELSGLTAQTDHMYQYFIEADLKVADPYSTIVLTESNDQYIDAITYPNLPAYPTGKTNHAVTLLRTGDAPFSWEITNFNKPAKTDLVIYELLIRDFDALHSFDAVKARLDYLQELGVNAIEFMPVSEFDGNESWGYNPSFHMALDKYYGTKTAFKQLIDECHKRGIAVILDVVYNHATGQNPYYRMWNTDNGNYGGQASVDSPFFNETAKHSYSVFNDFNHSQQATKDYVKRTTQYWIEEYKIDGFRWDLTKGFTQNCTASDEGCTNTIQADRVAVLKEYADYQWEVDPDFYVIFEHLGTNQEETEWVNYRLGEGKGIMMWSNLNPNYSETSMGYHDSNKSNFSWISYKNRGWTTPANISYMESHDEERTMYRNLNFGNSNASYDTQDLATALERQKGSGAFYFTVPGPKMIWQFGELGYEVSIDFNGRTGNKPIRWEYVNDSDRKALYDTWAKIIALKKQEDIFRTSNFTLDVAASTGIKKIHLTNDNATDDLQYITIIGNFGITEQAAIPGFQQTGTWYDLLNDANTITVTNVNQSVLLQPGEFKIYGSSAVTLSNEDIILNNTDISFYPNPSNGFIRINKTVEDVKIFDITGKKVLDYKGRFDENHTFKTQSLIQGLYIVRGKTENNLFSFKLLVR